MTMQPGIRYLVTRGSDDGTFRAGDHLYLCADGAIGCVEAQGWIDAADVPEATAGMEYEPDRVWIARRAARLREVAAEMEAAAEMVATEKEHGHQQRSSNGAASAPFDADSITTKDKDVIRERTKL